MDDIKRPSVRHVSSTPPRRTVFARVHERSRSETVVMERQRRIVRSIGKMATRTKKTLWERFTHSDFVKWPTRGRMQRLYTVTTLLLFITSTIAGLVSPYIDLQPYHMSDAARALLPEKNAAFGSLLVKDLKSHEYNYNSGGGSAASDVSVSVSNQPRFSATFGEHASDGIKVSDTISNIDMSLIPQFSLLSARKDENQLMYKLADYDGVLVYTSRTASVKEDLVLERYAGDTMTFTYKLGLQMVWRRG